jgi:hypothetical protein
MSVSPGNAPIQRLLAARALRLGPPFASEHAVVVQRPSFGEASPAFVARLLLLQTWQPGDQIELIAEEGRIVCARQVSAVLRTDAFGGAAVAAAGADAVSDAYTLLSAVGYGRVALHVTAAGALSAAIVTVMIQRRPRECDAALANRVQSEVVAPLLARYADRAVVALTAESLVDGDRPTRVRVCLTLG